MAITAPRFQAPDGKYRSNYNFTTDKSTRFFYGVMDADTVDMKVSIFGRGETSNPDIVYFEGSSFIIPNPSAYPQGLRLLPGSNVITAKSVLSNGQETDLGAINAILSLERDVRSAILPPSGVFVERMDQRVKILVEGLEDPNVVGYNFYASTAPGGGSVGYNQINTTMVISGDTKETTSSLGSMVTDSLVALNQDGTPKANPLYLRLVETQTDKSGVGVASDFDQVLEVPENTAKVRTTVQIDSVRQVQQFSFVHDRRNNESSSDYPTIPNAEFNTIPDTDPLYYVVSAVYLIDDQEYESTLSPEVAASPIVVSPAVASLPTVSRQQIVRDTSLSIFRSHPEVDIKPGAVLRDTFIDPFSTEAERIRFIIGFMQASQTAATLLAIDDPGNSGFSIPVNQSSYKLTLKKAFFLKDDTSTQNMIDNMFDHLAARRGVSRLTGSRARGEVTFYVSTKPSTSISLPIGTPLHGSNGTTFMTTSATSIEASGSATFYNPTTGRYYARAFVQAENAGSGGNLSAGQIQSIGSGGPSRVQVTNESPTFGGTDYESNRDLAVRADGVLSSVDSGTYRGYTQNAIEVPGIRQVNVVDAGHSLMMRDFDPQTNRHVGGKVDVWVRGSNLSTLTDSFAFSFKQVLRGQFEPVGAVTNLLFRAVNPALTVDNPIIQMLDLPSWEIFGLKDETTGKVLDLTGAVLIAPDKIQLSTAYNDPLSLNLMDDYKGSYRYRASNIYVPTRQPVSTIISLVGEKTGLVTSDIYKLFHSSDPLNLGRSSEAGDYLKVIQPIGSSVPVTIPSGVPVVVTGEQHVFLGDIELLGSLGINPLTVHIWNIDRTIEYRGPYKPLGSGDADFTFVDESGSTPMGFKATSTARFVVGDTLWVDYEHDENFLVTYTTNSLVALTQSAIDGDRHVTADVVVKDTIPTGVNIKATVVLLRNQVLSKVDGAIRTNLARLFGAMALGQPVRQSDILAIIDNTPGVSYVVAPLVTLCKTDGAIIVRESLVSEVPNTDFVQITDTRWNSNNLVDVFILTQPLESGTINGGGAINDFRSVFNGPVQFTNYDTLPDDNGVPIKNLPNAAFIIGNEGMNIPGYSDDVTIREKYPSVQTDTDVNNLRIMLTRRRVLLALDKGTTPATGSFTASYVVYGDSGVKNLLPGPTDYLELGELDFTYDEDVDFEALVRGKGR